MSIEGIKSDFYNYLIDTLKKPEDKEEIGKLSDFSIFKYSKEFKEFLTDEYKVSSDILAMDITDILKLELKNGQLIKEEDGEIEKERNENIIIGIYNKSLTKRGEYKALVGI